MDRTPHGENFDFASDNVAGVCPEAWDAMAAVNRDAVPSYGDDDWTQKACDRFRELFETDCQVYFTFNGTAANSLALASLAKSYHSLICHEAGHVETDECGAPEFFTNGMKLLLVGGDAGKVDLDQVEQIVRKRSDIHYPKPRVLSITQATELGTVYSPSELAAIGERAKSLGLRIHMDGARFANAAAELNVPPKQLTWEAGVDVLCFGGTKQGLAFGEAVVFFDDELAEEFDYRCKQAGQLASKMRFLSAPWLHVLDDEVWLDHARHANAMAQKMHDAIAGLPGVSIAHPRQANSVFVRFDAAIRQGIESQGYHVYDFIGGATRIMCSWATTDQQVSRLVEVIRAAADRGA